MYFSLILRKFEVANSRERQGDVFLRQKSLLNPTLVLETGRRC